MRLFLVGCVSLALLGCSHNDPAPVTPQPQAGAPSNQAPAPSRLADMKTEVCACKDMACTENVEKKWIAKLDNRPPTDDDKRVMAEMSACVSQLATKDVEDFHTGVDACDEVIAAYERYFECDAFKAAGDAAMQAARDGLDAMKQGWASLRDAPQASKDAAATGCNQALDGLRQGAKAMGCTL
jgi:hypothetical protein